MAVAANVCQNDTQAAGSPLSGSFGIAGVTLLYFLDILEDQDNELLYFIGYFGNPAPQDTIIYKSDPDLAKVQVMTYDIFCNYRSYAISPAKDFIYIQDWTTHKIFEVRTSDLVISRELAVSAASATLDSNMEIGKGFFFSLAFGSILHTCRWDMSNTNLDCFTLGVGSQINFAPVSEELLFFGSTDTAADQYYLMNYNFSSSSSLWKKSIACPTSGCVSKFSNSLLSRDEEWIYTMVLYDANFIFHKLSIADGSPQSSGLIWNDSGYYNSYCIKEFSDFVAIQIRSSSLLRIKRLILVTPSATEITKEYNSVDSSAYAVGKLLYKGEEMMYHSGRISTNDTFFFGRSPINNTGQLSEFEQDTPLFSPITTNYQVSPTTSNPSISTNTKTLTISTTSSITTTDITSSTNPSFNRYVALWNQDYSQIVQSNKLVKLEFTWACAQSVNNTAITFSLAQTGSNAVPDWVQLDASSQELYLNATPKLAEEKNFYFLLQISFNSEVHYKKFEITVEECSIQNCELCTLGSPSICETCSDGYQSSDKKESCTKVVSISETKEVETKESKPVTETTVTQGLVISSIILASASSMLSLSSINSIFSIMNSLQLAILLPLIPDYFSPKVLAFLSEMGFTMLSFDFIKFKDIPFVEELTDWVSYPQSDGYLNSLGMRSGSSVVNYLSLMAIIILIGIINVGVFLCYRCTKNSKNRKCKKFTRKLFKFFTFNVYIRIFMQAFVFTTLSIFSELYNLNLDTIVTIVSFGVCVLFCLCTSVLFILSFIMYFKSFPTLNKVKYWPCIEYFNGVKSTKYSKLYSCMYMLMRVLLTSVIIFGQPTRQYDRATYFYLVNIAYCLYLIIVRPLENPQDNIIEIINQTLFCSLAVPLSWLDKKEAWTPFYEKFYTSVLMASPAIGSFICLIFLIKSIVICIQKWKANNRQQDVAPKEPSSHIRASQHLNHHNPSPSPYINNRSSNMSRSNAPFAPPRDTQSRPYDSSYPRRVQMTRKLDYRR
ncbi:unnamed protein product [Moneuplotes crassus]|uniref:Uncharacterized protein n=1 Tax=Euplotes crassus TaxID=5936 RepID=A0AAD2D607_EUPCR|nr:unnamed protein product [Moneuplotes crassus]